VYIPFTNTIAEVACWPFLLVLHIEPNVNLYNSNRYYANFLEIGARCVEEGSGPRLISIFTYMLTDVSTYIYIYDYLFSGIL